MPHYSRYELNITLACNAACRHCNRMCDRFPDRTEHMSVGQIERFVEQLRGRDRPAHKVKIAGGEPLCHPQFPEIYGILTAAVDEGLIGQLKVNTNCTIPIPESVNRKRAGVRWQGTTPSRHTYHLPYAVSPADLGYTPVNPGWKCPVPRRCGASLDYYGWLPCSASIMIVRLWGLEHLYGKDLPIDGWGFDEVCQHCPLSMPREWQKSLPADLVTSETWTEKLEKYDGVTNVEGY